MAEKKDQHWVAGHGSCSFLCDVGVSPPSDFSIESIIECYFKYSIAGKITLPNSYGSRSEGAVVHRVTHARIWQKPAGARPEILIK